jgi:hypothetical protein
VMADVNARSGQVWAPLLPTAAAFVEPYLHSKYAGHAHVARYEELMRPLISLGVNIHDRIGHTVLGITGTVLSSAIGRTGSLSSRTSSNWAPKQTS